MVHPDVQITEVQAFLGIPVILEYLAGTSLHTEKAYEHNHAEVDEERLVFTGSHFIVKIFKGGEMHVQDSYSSGFQLKNSHGLCMVFAAMIADGKAVRLLKQGDLIGNTKRALLWSARKLAKRSSPIPLTDIFDFNVDGEAFSLSVKSACKQLRKMARYIKYTRAIALQKKFNQA